MVKKLLHIIQGFFRGKSKMLNILVGSMSLLVLILIGFTFYGFVNGDLWGKKVPFFRHILIVDVFIFSLAVVLLVRQFIVLMRQRKQNLAGSQLHARIVKWLSWVAVTPAVVIALFCWVFFLRGIQTWFNERVHTALDQSTAVAEAYLEEHQKVLGVSTEAMAMDIAANWAYLRLHPEELDDFINAQSQLRSLNEAILFDTNSHVWARAHLTFSLDLFEVLREDLEKAQQNPVIYARPGSDRVRALVQVIPNENIYLLVGKYVDSKILKRISDTKDARSEYMVFQAKLDQSKLTLALIFMLITLLILVLSAWIGLWFAEQIARPLGKVIMGAESVSQGNLSTQIDAQTTEPDVQLLANTFNRMTTNLRLKQEELIEANAQIEARRQFTQSILRNVSTGVLSFDPKGKANLVNARALDILQAREDQVLGKKLEHILPEALDVVQQMGAKKFSQSQIHFQKSGHRRTLLVRVVWVSAEHLKDFVVVTFDDVTELMHAQKQAAWSDVARRIAHEIKNPLTPIQLSTERLRKKYSGQIHQDLESFHRCLDTIGRQVDHIGHLVSEFSAYAKMPQAILREKNLGEIIHQMIRFYQDSFPYIQFHIYFEGKNSKDVQNVFKKVQCDEEQMGQVFSNLFQNALDAIQQKHPQKGGQLFVVLQHEKEQLIISVHDNGPGFPTENREELLDPYVTYKEKGTGLGLAIVKKIINDHQGDLQLWNSDRLGGACVRIVLPSYVGAY